MDYIMEEYMNAAVLVMFAKDDPQSINNQTTVRMRTFTFPILHRPLGRGNQHIFFLDIFHI